MSLGVCDEQEGGKWEIGALFIFICPQLFPIHNFRIDAATMQSFLTENAVVCRTVAAARPLGSIYD
jgi:hypothetical protein